MNLFGQKIIDKEFRYDNVIITDRYCLISKKNIEKPNCLALLKGYTFLLIRYQKLFTMKPKKSFCTLRDQFFLIRD